MPTAAGIDELPWGGELAPSDGDDSAVENKLYHGVLKSFVAKAGNSGYGFIQCEELYNIYNRDVYVNASDLPANVKNNDLLKFSIMFNARGQPQAQCVELVQISEQTPPVTQKMDGGVQQTDPGINGSRQQRGPADGSSKAYRGILKTFSQKGGYGFIQCNDLAKRYERDIYVSATELEGLQQDLVVCGAWLEFSLVLNNRGQPQAQAISLIDTAEADRKAPDKLLPGLDYFEKCSPDLGTAYTGRLMSWNILAPAYATCANFPDAAPESLRWSRRASQIRAVFKKLAPDVVCLQEVEVDRDTAELGLPISADSFGCSSFCRPQGRSDGCKVIWRTDRLKLIQECHLSYDDYLLPMHDARFRTGHIAVVVELQGIQGQQVVIVNTHLACGLIAEDVRLWQLSILLSYLQNFPLSCTVLCGDFNSIPGGFVHRLLSSRFRSVYGDVEAGMATSSNALSEDNKGFADTIDYCWLLGSGVQAHRRLKLPSKEELRRLLRGRAAPTPIPTLVAEGSWPSDHLPIVVDFAFANSKPSKDTQPAPDARVFAKPLGVQLTPDAAPARRNAEAQECIDDEQLKELSSKVSWILRHGAKRTNLKPDKEGWVLMRRLMTCKYLEDMEESVIMHVIVESNKIKSRYEVRDTPAGREVRALEKHSIDFVAAARSSDKDTKTSATVSALPAVAPSRPPGDLRPAGDSSPPSDSGQGSTFVFQ